MAAVGMMSYAARDDFQAYPQQYPMYHQTRAHQPQAETAQSLSVNPYANYVRAPPAQAPPPSHAQGRLPPQPQEYRVPEQMQQQQRPPQQSGSPRLEDGSKPSLPSISNLLGIADGDRPGHDAASQQQALLQAQQQQQQQQQQIQQSQAVHQTQVAAPEQRQQYVAQDLPVTQRPPIPPTPPLRNDSVIEGTHSPSTISTGSSLSAQPYFMASALNNVEAADQRVAAANLLKRHSLPMGPNTSPFGSAYAQSPYHQSPGSVSNPAFYSPSDTAAYQSSAGMYQQRPLPSNFPPQPQHVPLSAQSTPTMPTTTNPWEHHHYISASAQATYPQSQDRYICATCSKAFSRPSSLKIHSHSHTGEKPFKCPHAGCGKAFSVRSNMKRHERGCHTGAAHAHAQHHHVPGLPHMM